MWDFILGHAKRQRFRRFDVPSSIASSFEDVQVGFVGLLRLLHVGRLDQRIEFDDWTTVCR